ncbi:6-phospho-3-hexuloisomerase [Curtobacterium sp. MCLR17_007]|uniref:6-phospho-3-hexuloisomerase n=1 Tax=unclassified Curtobacterium TaxID=257496 RepID=UPI0006F2C8B2|nr:MULTISPECIES: 6-phospho-3-hexuloisomerase [unclassified Curtobacterium]KQS10039.1 3-hexulose-6-phosphate isomerase [Curtobacterium sp. Leaf183]WIB60071.1 6-phospho-3-hexuloisomerase [Curtobacterium sp. MCLR17_007]
MAQPTVPDALDLVVHELDDLVAGLRDADQAPSERALDLLGSAARVFVHGAGRSGLALRMTAMRLMHLGLQVHVVGEVTTPAIRSGDVLLVASGSGTTTGIVQAARTASDEGASVLAISTTDDSPLSELATVTLVLPAATKTDRSGTASAQYAGSLFEQGVVLLGDALFHSLWQRSGRSADELWPRHANLE